VNDQNVHNGHTGRYARLRYTATGALAALAAVGLVAGAVALAANPGAKAHGHAAVASAPRTKTVTAPLPVKPTVHKTGTPQPAVARVFLNDVQRLVDAGTITAAEAQVLDGEIQAGRVDTDTLASSGFTANQLQAVQQALTTTKLALAARVPRPQK
jgi:hypothetical protein